MSNTANDTTANALAEQHDEHVYEFVAQRATERREATKHCLRLSQVK